MPHPGNNQERHNHDYEIERQTHLHEIAEPVPSRPVHDHVGLVPEGGRKCGRSSYRYSYDEGLIDFARGEIVPFEQLLDEILELTGDDASKLGCESEVSAVRDILSRGTSAHRQLKAHELSIAAGNTPEQALQAVVDTLVADTAEGL